MGFIDSITNGGKLSGLTSGGIIGKTDPNGGLTGMINSAINAYLSDTITKIGLGGVLGGNSTDNPSGITGTISPGEAIKAAQANTSRTNIKAYTPAKINISCFIINLITNESVTFECEPEDFSDSNSANFESVEIRGRSSPYQGYSNSGPRTISFTAPLYADLCPQGLQNTINKLKALVYPKYDQGVIVPPLAYFHVGYMISCRCIVNSVDITYKTPIRDHFYINCEASFSLTEVREGDAPLSAEEVENNGQYTFK